MELSCYVLYRGDVPQEAPNNVLEKPSCLRLDKLGHHVAQYGANCIKSLVRGAYVVKPIVVEQDLLDDKDSNGLAEFRTGLHDTQTERNYLCCQEKVDDFGGIVFDQRTNDTKTGQAKVFERSRLGGGVEKGVEK
jgi:hypothetical protein